MKFIRDYDLIDKRVKIADIFLVVVLVLLDFVMILVLTIKYHAQVNI
jgi:hypothetical protein